MKNSPYTDDAFLGGKIILRQPMEGYRSGIDAVLLAASIKARPGEKILDVGCGVGAALLCALARMPEVQGAGLDVQEDLVLLAKHNATLNDMQSRAAFHTANLNFLPPDLKNSLFDHVLTNPPYGIQANEVLSPHHSKALANQESSLTLAEWIHLCCRRVKPQGTLTIICRSDRLQDILKSIRDDFGGIIVFPLHPRQGAMSIRVIVQARKDSRQPLHLASGLVLHEATGPYTPQTTGLLRSGLPLSLTV